MKFKIYYRTLAFWVGVGLFTYNIENLTVGWLSLSICIYLYLALTMSVGYHRLFAHKSFKCHSIWHWIFAISGSASLMSSPLQWNISHRQHHQYSDTENDPQSTSFDYFFRLKAKPTEVQLKPSYSMLKSNMHRFVHKYSLLFFILGCFLSLLISFNFFVFGFMFPISLSILAIGLHHIFSHKNKSPIDAPIMEFVIPMAGEWIHKTHHNYPNRWDVGQYDIGALFIRVIKND